MHQHPAALPGFGYEFRRFLEELTQVFARQFAQKRKKESVHGFGTRLCAFVHERMVYSIRASAPRRAGMLQLLAGESSCSCMRRVTATNTNDTQKHAKHIDIHDTYIYRYVFF